MKNFRLIAAAAFLLPALAVVAHAETIDTTTVQCKRMKGSSCEERTVLAFARLGCKPIASTVYCRDAASDPMVDPQEIRNVRGKDFCTVTSECREPTYGNFGQVSCRGGDSVDLRSADRSVTLTTSVGFFRHYVTTLCK